MDTPKRALVVSPHPDDAEFGCAGTVARWVKDGAEVMYILCTSGDKGSQDPEMTPQRLAAIREEEQLNAARTLGVKEVLFFRYPDGEVEDTREFRGRLVREIRRHKPEVVLTTDPYKRTFHQHRDHRICGQVTLDALFPYARDRLHFPEHLAEGLSTHKVATLLFWGSDEPNIYVDIAPTLELKMQALGCHRSQLNGRDPELVREFSRRHAQKAGLEYAEAFRRMDFPG